MHLTNGWKIGIIGLIVAFIGWSLQGVNILEIWFNVPNFYFVTVWFVGMTIITYGIIVRYREKQKEQPKKTITEPKELL